LGATDQGLQEYESPGIQACSLNSRIRYKPCQAVFMECMMFFLELYGLVSIIIQTYD
jgi:hypothetical protein